MTIELEAKKYIKLFKIVNNDLELQEECDLIVPLTDVEYYTDQVFYLTNEEDYDLARKIAIRMSELN